MTSTNSSLDISLINEFSRRPGLYDRSSPYYKDKLYISQSWNDMSQKLGFEVRLLKERMLQLRNRYNLEKRRIDEIRSKYPKRIVRSQWPLFNHMDFMSGHIKHRRSFKTMIPRQSHRLDNSNTPMTVVHGKPRQVAAVAASTSQDNDVKYGNVFELDEEESEHFMGMDHDGYIDENTDMNVSQSRPLHTTSSQEPLEMIVTQPEIDKQVITSYSLQQTEHKNNVQCIIRKEKYESFGKFLALSLFEMPEEKSVKLMQKFMNDLICCNNSSSSLSSSSSPPSVTTNIVSTHNEEHNNTNHENPIMLQNIQTVLKQEKDLPTLTPRTNHIEEHEEQQDHENIVVTKEDPHNIINNGNNTNNYNGGEEFEDDDDEQVIYDLTEEEEPRIA